MIDRMRVSGTSSPGCGPAAAGTGAAAGFGAAGACTARCWCCGCRGLRRATLLYVLQHIVLGDAAARACARNLPQIELMLLRNLAHQRRRAQPLAMRCRSGSLGRGSSRTGLGRRSRRSVRRCCRCGSRGSARLCSAAADHRNHGVDLDGIPSLYLDFGKRAARRRWNLRVHLVGRNLKQRLVPLYAVADLLQPLGDRPFEDRLAHLRHDDIRAAATGNRGRCGRCLRRFRLLLFLRGLLLGRCWSSRSRLAGNRAIAFADYRNHGVDLHRIARIDFDLGKRPARRRWNLRVHLVGRNLKQRFVALYAVAGLLQPLGDRPFEDRFAHLRHDDVCWHLFVPPSHSCGILPLSTPSRS